MKRLLFSVCATLAAFGFSAGAAQAEFTTEGIFNFETGQWNHIGSSSRASRTQRAIDTAALSEDDDDEVERRQRPKQRASRQTRQRTKAAQRPAPRRTVTAIRPPTGGKFVRRTVRPASTTAAIGGGQTSGIASYYWQGQRVASGGWFNPNAMTAAHKTLPFGTRVRVTHARSGRSVDVTINDRGPYVRGRVIDLSRAAAGALGMQGAGLASVQIEVLGR